ncbi:cell division protein FtsQ/DivIB [Spirochaeta africana]|uniref:cell division protein FtsQ/DivIB n=1 Tax=Spirochaeta africana TaxID=46355 RepID=UPI00145D7249|nr:FtsQ-type POTRA domain-containing protein [Spirochaeta africana]
MADRVMYQQSVSSRRFEPEYRKPVRLDSGTQGDWRGGTGHQQSGGFLKRLLFVMLFVGSALIVAELLFQTQVAPRVAITEVIIEGDVRMSSDDLLEYAGLASGDLYFSVDTARIEQALRAIPRVETVEVTKSFPGTLRIALSSRTPLAITMGGLGRQAVPVVVDSHGVAFAWGVPEDYRSLPVLGGFEIDNVELGSRLPSAMRGVLQDLEQLRLRHPVLFDVISEVEFKPIHEHRFDLQLYFTHVPVPVLIGEDLQPDKISGIIRILDVLAAQGMIRDIREIDFRGDDVIYTKREG